jgi:hypothetical protein
VDHPSGAYLLKVKNSRRLPFSILLT